MRFDAFIFPVFFIAVLAMYWAIRDRRGQNALILISSYIFYGWWDWRFLLLIFASTVVDFLVASAIQRRDSDPAARKRLVTASVVVNLGILGLFKYFDFFVGSAAAALQSLGLEANLPLLQIVLPVGISFYTFQTLGYTIDVYRRDQPAEPDFLSFACYVAFFPQLVAGPIERASRLVPQFNVDRTIDLDGWRTGLTLVVYGLVKKIAIADNMAPYADYVFGVDDASTLPGPLALAGTLAFAIQIYADFSGYSDVARGTARLMGFELCVNFDQPYRSRTPSEFWRRWHISLSQWLRDYLYIPLGGNRSTALLTYRNLMLTMVLGGLWHGAAWNFVAWGFFWGLVLCLYRVADIDGRLKRSGAAAHMLAFGAFWLLTQYSWMLFRAKSWDQVVGMTTAYFGGWDQWQLALPMFVTIAWFATPIAVHHALAWRLDGEKWQPMDPWAWRAVLAAIVLFGILNARASETAFIYFQF